MPNSGNPANSESTESVDSTNTGTDNTNGVNGTEKVDGNSAEDDSREHEKKSDDGRTFTQAEVDQLVQSEVSRIVRKKAEDLYRRRVGDVDIEELKAKAGESRTLEDRVTAMERRATEAEASALRSRIANEFNVSAEDAELFLTGTDEEMLTTQAKRLSQRDNERKQRGPQLPNEGRTPKSSTKADETREFASFLTGRRT